MDANIYAVEVMAGERLAELRAAGVRVALLESVRGERGRGVSAAVGGALIRLGHWLAPDEAVAPPNAGVRVAR